MNKKYNVVPLCEVMTHYQDYIDEPEPITYPKLSVKLYGKGAVLDTSVEGSSLKMKKHQIARKGQVILSEIWGKKGAIGIVPPEGDGALCTSHFFLFDVRDDKIEQKYLQAIFTANYLEEQLNVEAQGTTGYAAVRPKHLLAATIPLPSLEEQRRIVARIEELAAKIEEARGLRREAVEETEILLSSSRARFFDNALQQNVQNLSDVATLERGKFSHRPRNDPFFFGGEHPWIQIGEIEQSGKYIKEWTQTLNDEGLKISKKFPKGTLLVSIAATIGSVGILDFDCCIPDSIVAVIPKPGVFSEYLYHYFGYVRSHLEFLAPQSAQKNINLELLSPLHIPLLDMSQQKEIIVYLDDLQAKVDTLKQQQSQTSAELNALLPSILDKAFKGEL
jgi:type I restriction enzyme S subunit